MLSQLYLGKLTDESKTVKNLFAGHKDLLPLPDGIEAVNLYRRHN